MAITGEKTQKVTESVLDAITPKKWIDGKILGLTVVVLVNVVCYGIGYLLYKAAAVVILKQPFSLPVGIEDPVALAYLLLFAMLQFGFWFTLFRRAAGRVFGVSMLLTGKEPSWGEVWRWVREG